MAKEKMLAAEEDMRLGHKDDFTRVLPIFPGSIETVSLSMKGDMDYVIKKASIPIQLHEGSNWTDDCYLEIGKARYYNNDFDNATQTFKYINAKFDDKTARANALIWLMRTYNKTGELEASQDVSNFIVTNLRKQLKGHVKKYFYLARAEYYLNKRDFERALRFLVGAKPLLKGKWEKARINFILGQLYQIDGQEQYAYLHYKTALRKNPGFEMEFHARLKMAQVSNNITEKEKEKIRKFFEKQLKDPNNRDLKSSIYYELALFELKQGQRDTCFAYLHRSTEANGSEAQKALSWLKMGQLYFEEAEYYKAEAPYTSAYKLMDKDLYQYPAVSQRQKILAEFVHEYDIVKQNDSLLNLANMDSTELAKLIAQKATEKQKQMEEEAKDKEKAERQARRAERYSTAFDQEGGGFNTSSGNDGQEWYFYNVAAVSQGQSAFANRWGNRKLEDHWRRSNKETKPEQINEPTANADTTQTATQQPTQKQTDAPSQSEIAKSLMAGIPQTDQAKAEKEKELLDAMLNLGKIYDQRLNEDAKAIATFEKLIDGYPNYERRPEAMYNLCLMLKQYDNTKYNRLKNYLTSEYPESLYAKLILNPNYRSYNEQRNQQINPLYKRAYDLYRARRYVEATQQLEQIEQQYPGSDYQDHVTLLKTMIKGQSLDIETYIQSLAQFIAEREKSPVLPFAQDLLDKAREFKKSGNVPTGPKPPQPNQSPYDKFVETEQYYVLMFPIGSIPVNEVKTQFAKFHRNYYDRDIFTVTDLIYNQKYVLVYVKSLKSKVQAELYYRQMLKEDMAPLKLVSDGDYYHFLATPANFKTLYQLQKPEDYIDFFKAYYNTKL